MRLIFLLWTSLQRLLSGFFMQLFLIVLVLTVSSSVLSGSVSEKKGGIERIVQYSFTLHNTNNTLVPKAEFWTYVPVASTAHQELVSFDTGMSANSIEDAFGNQILHFIIDDIAPFSTKIIKVKAKLKMFHEPRQKVKADLQLYLKAEKNIESQASEIIKQAKKFKEEDKLKKAKQIYQWVSSVLSYSGYLKNDRGALWALINKKGDCTEFSNLFTALCRASGIPARPVGGYVIDKNSMFRPGDYHNWAEFYADGLWRIADPQKKIFMKNESQYVAMRIIGQTNDGNNKVFDLFRSEGEGIRCRMIN
jgi:transglutaminase-like putative cysteine protease